MGISACLLATFCGFVRKLGMYILSFRMCVLNFGMYIQCLRMERGRVMKRYARAGVPFLLDDGMMRAGWGLLRLGCGHNTGCHNFGRAGK